jgi:hypothetical protein
MGGPIKNPITTTKIRNSCQPMAKTGSQASIKKMVTEMTARI